jgi:hypothetical protein
MLSSLHLKIFISNIYIWISQGIWLGSGDVFDFFSCFLVGRSDFGSFYPWVVVFLVLGVGVHVGLVVVVLNFGVIKCVISFGYVFPKFSYVDVSCAFGSLNQEKIMKIYLCLFFFYILKEYIFSKKLFFPRGCFKFF